LPAHRAARKRTANELPHGRGAIADGGVLEAGARQRAGREGALRGDRRNGVGGGVQRDRELAACGSGAGVAVGYFQGVKLVWAEIFPSVNLFFANPAECEVGLGRNISAVADPLNVAPVIYSIR
jgi:hypothetical protein